MRGVSWVLLSVFFAGCFLDRSGSRVPTSDAGSFDAGGPALDAGAPLAPDAGMDAGTVDAGAVDAGADAGPSIPADWWDPAWNARRRLTFDNGPHAEDLDDFPVLVVLGAARVDYALAGDAGEALRFVDADGAPLDHEIELWDPAGASFVWVRVPRIDASSTTDHVWMYYDRPGATDAQNADGTWASPFRGVWHLAGDFADASGNGNDGSPSAAADAPGIVGNGRSFAVGEHSTVADADSLDLPDAVTISAWMRPTSLAHQLAVLSKRESCEGEANYALFVRNDDRLQFEHHDGSWRIFPRGTVAIDTWQWVVATFDTATDEVRVFIDGAQVGEPMDNSRELRTDANAIELARNGGCAGDYMEGPMDEIRLEAIARSPAWVAAQYRSMTDVYVTFGPAERIR